MFRGEAQQERLKEETGRGDSGEGSRLFRPCSERKGGWSNVSSRGGDHSHLRDDESCRLGNGGRLVKLGGKRDLWGSRGEGTNHAQP